QERRRQFLAVRRLVLAPRRQRLPAPYGLVEGLGGTVRVRGGVAAGEDHLEGDETVQPQVAGLVDDTHAAPADFAQDLVTGHFRKPRGRMVRRGGGGRRAMDGRGRRAALRQGQGGGDGRGRRREGGGDHADRRRPGVFGKRQRRVRGRKGGLGGQ